MENTVARPVADRAPARPRPGLALVLALLSLPGSTVAWELPSGGLWIGLLLAVAAIVLGLGSRRRAARRSGSRMALAAIVIGALAIGYMLVWYIVSVLT